MAVTYGIVLGLNGKEWNSDSKHGVGGSSITVVSSLSWITPGWALQSAVECQTVSLNESKPSLPVKFVEIVDASNGIHINSGIFGDLVHMSLEVLVIMNFFSRDSHSLFEELLHVGAHGFAVNVLSDPCVLQLDIADSQIPWACANHSRVKQT